jgi:hypothetical protein
MTSMVASTSTQFAPCTAEAATPAITPPVASAAPWIRSRSVTSCSRGT